MAKAASRTFKVQRESTAVTRCLALTDSRHLSIGAASRAIAYSVGSLSRSRGRIAKRPVIIRMQ